MDYVTVASVTTALGAGWNGTFDANRAVIMANAWLNSKFLPTYDDPTVVQTLPVCDPNLSCWNQPPCYYPNPIPQPILQAGAEIAQVAALGLLYHARTEGLLTSKRVKADSVESDKHYAATGQDALPISAGELFALQLIKPYGGPGINMTARLSRT
jgi:hypothetical protein